jgi:hypothetical protein
MRNNLGSFVICVLAGLALASCGSSSSQPGSAPTQTQPPPALTQAQTTSVVTAITNVENAVAPQLIQEGIKDIAQSTTSSVPVGISQACADAGTVTAMGTASITPAASNPGTASINMTSSINYAKCTSAGVELDGSLGSTGLMNFAVSNAGATIASPVTFTITGSHTFVINNVTGTISFNCLNSLSFDPNTNTFTALVATGPAVLQYPTGQNPTNSLCSTFASGFDLSLLNRLSNSSGGAK